MKNNQLKDVVLALIAFCLSFSVYFYTLCPTISAYADAGEFPVAAAISGIGHPSGYPLFILILKLFILLPFENLAFKANLAAAFFGAVTVALFYLLIKIITKCRLSAFIGALILAFSKIFWRNSLVAEVFTLLAFFIVLTFLLFYLWATTKNKKFFYGFLLASGFGIGHHQLLLATLFPLFIWFLVEKKWQELDLKDYFLGILTVLVGFLPYIYVVFAARNIPPLNWENPQTMLGLIRLISRAGYAFRLTIVPEQISFLPQISEVIKIFLESFTFLGIAFAFLGLFKAFKLNQKIFSLSLFIIIVTGFLFSLFSGMPLKNPIEIQYLERFQIIPTIFIALLISLGILQIKELVLAKIGNRFLPIILVFFVAIPLVIFLCNFNKVNQRGNYFGEYLGEDILSTVPKDSIFIFESDALINSLFYQRYVLKKREDVTFIVGGILAPHLKWYLEELEKHYPDIVLSNSNLNSRKYLLDFIKKNSVNKKIVLLIPNLENVLQLDLIQTKVPIGLVERYLLPEEVTNIGEKSAEIEAQLIDYYNKGYKNLAVLKKYPRDWPESSLLCFYSWPYVYLAQRNLDNPFKAENYYQKGLEIYPNYSKAWLGLGDLYYSRGESEKSVEFWKKALETSIDETITTEAREKIFWQEL